MEMKGLFGIVLILALCIFCASEALAKQLLAQGEAQWRQYDQAAQQAFNSGDLTTAEAKWRQALDSADQSSSIEPGVANILCSLAKLYNKKGDVAESERLYELAMRNLEGTIGIMSSRYTDYLADLGWLYYDHGRMPEAEDTFKKAVTIRERIHGINSLKVAESLDVYAQFLHKVNRGTEGDILSTRAATIRSGGH